MKVKINKSNLDFLMQKLKNENPELLKSFEKSMNDYLVIFEIDFECADELRDWVEEELQKAGFDESYNLNEKGKILKEISDNLFS
jgi:hypothetical protein